ncbi:MAG: glycosyltransferase [Acidobacteriota bacterium]
MRILFVTNNFPNPQEPTRGMFNAQTSRALARTHEVVVVAPTSWRDAWRSRGRRPAVPRLEYREGAEVHHPLYWYPPGIFRAAYEWCFWQSVRRTVRTLLLRFRPEVVLGFWIHPDGGTAVRIARDCNVPGVVMAGGSDVLVLGRNPIRRRVIAGVLRRADAVVSVSHHLKGAIEALGVPGGRVHVVDNGVDPGLFFPADRAMARRRLNLDGSAPMFLWVGRMVPVKGLDVLLDGFATAVSGLPSPRLCLAGDGPLRDALARRVVGLGIADRVRFIGNVANNELPDWYRAADVTVLPSWSEGSPNVLLESIACGTPFMASAVGGVPEIADADLDVLVPPGDVNAWAAAIRRRASSTTEPGPARLRSTWDQQAQRLESVFQLALAARRSPSAGVSGLTELAGTRVP